MKARHRLGKFLLRHGRQRPEGVKAWTKKHREWIKSHVRFEEAALEATLADYVDEVDPTAPQLMGYSGLVASEHTTGNRVQRGGLTKTGNSHLRRVVVEAAWAYQHRPNVIGHLLRRQKDLAISDEVKDIAWKAQQRLHKRYKAMDARGKNKNQIVAALGRELLGFIWAIGVKTEQQRKLAKAA